MGKAGPGPKPAFAKTWSKAFVSLRLKDTVCMEFSQGLRTRPTINNTTQIPMPKFQRHLGELHTNSILQPQGNERLTPSFCKHRFRTRPSLPQANTTPPTACVLFRKLFNVRKNRRSVRILPSQNRRKFKIVAGISVKRNWTPSTGLRRGKSRCTMLFCQSSVSVLVVVV